MLDLVIAKAEGYDESSGRFVVTDSKTVQLEYSLKALSIWESKWQVAFINNKKLTPVQYTDFIQCMVVNGDLSIEELSQEHFKQIEKYLSNPCTATKIQAKSKGGKKQVMTSEVFYAIMAQTNIPFECENWNLNRLSKLIDVINSFTNGAKRQKKTPPNEILRRNAELNAKRRAELNTKG